MISYLSGKIINKGGGSLIICVNDVGYKVFVNSSLFAEVASGQHIQIYTHQNVREDALDLYGFKNPEELEIFELLLSVSGIGPKTALGVLAAGNISEIKGSIARGDSSLLTKVSGIGKKTAERVVLELREKVGHIESAGLDGSGTDKLSANSDEIDALVALGYSLQQARDALQAIDPQIKNSAERVKLALRNMR